MKGERLEPGLSGDNIKLGTIELKCVAGGISELWLYDSDRGGDHDDFLLMDGRVLDEQIVNGVNLAEVNNVPNCEGDFDGDGDVDGSDLAIFAEDFGRTDCPH